MKRASHGSIAKARFKLGSKYTGGCVSVVNHRGSALIIHEVVHSIVYNLLFADCLLEKKKSMLLYLVRDDLITEEVRRYCEREKLCCWVSRWLVMKCTKPKPEAKFLCCACHLSEETLR